MSNYKITALDDVGPNRVDKTRITGTNIQNQKRALDVIARSGMLGGLTWDAFSVTRPLETQEIWTLLIGGLSGATVATVTLNYTDSRRCELLDGEVVTP